MSDGRLLRAAVLALLVAAAALIAARARYTADLSAFLPQAPTATQRLLVEQLREGPAARILIAALGGGEAPERARVSAALAQELRAQGTFASISNGDAASLERDRRFLFAHRYLLSPSVVAQRFTVAGLHAAIADSIESLASPEGPLVKPLFPQDPTGELLGILDGFGAERAPRTSAGVWASRDGAEALLMIETRASGSDTDAQERAVHAVQGAFAHACAPPGASCGLTLTLSGPPVFAVTSRALITREVVRLSGLSAALITLLLLFAYRSVSALFLGLLPVAAGALAGVAAVAAGFGTVHGITLGFGVTLIGEAVDYSIYLFLQAGSPGAADFRARLWPTLRLGALTSIVGFAALLPSDFPGLAQLGLYSVAGLAAAAAVTRFVLPDWIPRRLALRDLSSLGRQLLRGVHALRRLKPALLLVLIAAVAVILLHHGPRLSRELAALSPVPLAEQDLDERLRTDLGAPDVRYMVIVPAASAESALAASAAVAQRLSPLLADGTLSGIEAPSRYLPPAAAQRQRLAALPDAETLRARLAEALAGLAVRPGVLEPFIADVAAARTAVPLRREDLAGTSFASAVDALLVRTGGSYSALLPLSAASGDLPAQAIGRVQSLLAGNAEHAQLLDLKGETDRLYGSYLRQALVLAAAGLAAVTALLAFALRCVRRLGRVLLPLLLAVLAVAAALIACGHELTILHLVGLLLVVAVGSNYALFFDRLALASAHASPERTVSSILIANLATVIAFGVLATARVPLLSDLGSAVAPGTLLALLFAAALSAPERPGPR
ncbi:MAG: MMPL family transporter [Proteobacteria bacterium]|nr:MMPL family transporter [Pseudomonadota bacterium]